MASKKTLLKKIDPLLGGDNIFVGILIFSLILLAGYFVGKSIFSGNDGPEITEDQIQIQNGDEIITINRNGLVEYRSEDKVTYKIWDAEKVSTFFENIEQKAREYLANPSDTTNCIFVSLYLDGELVTVCFDEDDPTVNEVLDEFGGDDGGGIDLDDLFGDGDDDEDDDLPPDDISGYFDTTPTPTPIPTTTGSDDDDGDGDGIPPLPTPLPVEASCESWEEQIVGNRAIISNTLCSIQPTE